jgi:hypothetical protein
MKRGIPRSFVLTVTLDHFKLAKIDNATGFYAAETCPVAQTLKAKFPRRKVYVLTDEVQIGRKVFDMDRVGRKLVQQYDLNFLPASFSRKFGESVKLPAKVKFTERLKRLE